MAPYLKIRELESGSRQHSVFGVGIAFMVFTTIVIGLRVYVRAVMLRAMGVDDVLMVIGTVVGFGLSITCMISAYHGVGRHYYNIPSTEIVPILKGAWTTRVLYVLAMMFVKLSILWFYLRLDHRYHMKWSVYALIVVVLGLSIASVLVSVFSCTPPSKFWDITGTAPGHCLDPDLIQTFYEVYGIINIITDIVIYAVPLPMLWHVQISKGKKYALFGVFSLGILSIAAGCVRYDMVKKLENHKDMLYYLADSMNWCSIEIYIAIFCGSAPALSVIIKTWAPKVFGSSNSAKYESQGPTGGISHSRALSGRHRMSRQQRLDRMGMEGSEVAIVQPGENEIMMKTDIRMEVSDRTEEDGKHPTGCQGFVRSGGD